MEIVDKGVFAIRISGLRHLFVVILNVLDIVSLLIMFAVPLIIT